MSMTGKLAEWFTHEFGGSLAADMTHRLFLGGEGGGRKGGVVSGLLNILMSKMSSEQMRQELFQLLRKNAAHTAEILRRLKDAEEHRGPYSEDTLVRLLALATLVWNKKDERWEERLNGQSADTLGDLNGVSDSDFYQAMDVLHQNAMQQYTIPVLLQLIIFIRWLRLKLRRQNRQASDLSRLSTAGLRGEPITADTLESEALPTSISATIIVVAKELFGLLADLWRSGNKFLGMAFAFVLLWPFIITAVVLIEGVVHRLLGITPTGFALSGAAGIATLLFLAATVTIFVAFTPVGLLVLAYFKKGRTFLWAIAAVLIAELMLGICFTVVPFGTAPDVLLLFLPAFGVVALLAIFGRLTLAFWATVLLLLPTVWMAFYGGFSPAMEHWKHEQSVIFNRKVGLRAGAPQEIVLDDETPVEVTLPYAKQLPNGENAWRYVPTTGYGFYIAFEKNGTYTYVASGEEQSFPVQGNKLYILGDQDASGKPIELYLVKE
jgi:hypothetical protein